ncbi:hypothetical protein TSAR_006093 [Trichomalopsis sarcophagae]|uniref:Uncharacterized protein n=1 Tax=Trichomalopsis sarcophagae TaxID=543379 RepID=A0A232EMS3_9HYME|nr:hypothetical protein TSAR_006093 [Trichomalopsis sarcophagae]
MDGGSNVITKKSSSRSRSSRPREETEEEGIIRRFQDAQRMARFRARKKKALEDLQQQQQAAIETAVKSAGESEPESRLSPTESHLESTTENNNKYAQLLAVIERLGRDVRLSYAGSRSSAERLKSGIGRARTLVRDCLIETRLNLR